MTKGIKFDSNKPEYGLVPANALHEIVKVLTYGAQKYSRENWRQVPERERRYFDAMMRHLWAVRRGELVDEETGLSHYAHAGCCLLYLLEMELDPAVKENDDEVDDTEVVGYESAATDCYASDVDDSDTDRWHHRVNNLGY